MPDPLPKSAVPVPTPSRAADPSAHTSAPHWLRQFERLLRVMLQLYLGLMVCFVPWFPPAWDNNPLFLHAPMILPILTSGAFRGIVSGLGLLNLWIALQQAIHSSNDWQ